MFSIEIDASRALLNVTMWGFMNVAEVAEFSRQEQEAVSKMGLKSGEFCLLVNTEGAVIQSQEVVSAFMDIIVSSPLKARRIAVVRESSLSRMQTNRILMVRDNSAIFADLADAENWLFASIDTDISSSKAPG